MAQQEDKERQGPQGRPGTTKDGATDNTARKDPDLYDPVGMAGDKAGIVKEIEQELKEEDKKEQPGKSEDGKSRT